MIDLIDEFDPSEGGPISAGTAGFLRVVNGFLMPASLESHPSLMSRRSRGSTTSAALGNLLHEVLEDLIDVGVFFGRDIVIVHVVFPSKSFGLCFENPAFILQVTLVSNKDHRNPFLCMLLDALQPAVHVAEGFFIGHVKGNDDALGLLVERQRKSSEPLLACGVPDFHLHLLVHALGLVGLTDKVKTEGGHV